MWMEAKAGIDGVPEWGTATTAGLLEVGQAVREAVATPAVLCVTGVAGVGKTGAVAAALRASQRERGRDAAWLTFRSRPTMASVREALWGRLWPGRVAPRSRIDFEHGVPRAFERTPRTLIVDHADVLPKDALEYFAALAEDPHVDLALIVIGSPAWGAALPKRVPKLRSLTYRRVRLEPLTDTEAVTVVPGLHPVWADTTARAITDLNRDVGGTLSGWHRITAHRPHLRRRNGRVAEPVPDHRPPPPTGRSGPVGVGHPRCAWRRCRAGCAARGGHRRLGRPGRVVVGPCGVAALPCRAAGSTRPSPPRAAETREPYGSFEPVTLHTGNTLTRNAPSRPSAWPRSRTVFGQSPAPIRAG
ncbi:ATP-binding protein [Embleya sp. NPDC005971]|uniref:ATP-binding protein n=1 Tax=Embleya sp. NPDC005971 TaxID=3156724 RepID=UPI003407976D